MIQKTVALRLTVECPHCGVTHPVYRFEDKTTCWSCEHSFPLLHNQWEKWLSVARGESKDTDKRLRLPEAALVHPNGKPLNRQEAGRFNITVTQVGRIPENERLDHEKPLAWQQELLTAPEHLSAIAAEPAYVPEPPEAQNDGFALHCKSCGTGLQLHQAQNRRIACKACSTEALIPVPIWNRIRAKPETVPFYFVYQFKDEAEQLTAELPFAIHQRIGPEYVTGLPHIPEKIQTLWAQHDEEDVKAALAARADLLPQAANLCFSHKTKHLRQRVVWEALLANPVVSQDLKQKIQAFLEQIKTKKPVAEGFNDDGTSKEKSYVGYAFLLGWVLSSIAAYIPIQADDKTLGVKLGFSIGIGLLGGLGAIFLYAIVIHPLIMKFRRRRGY